MQWETVIGLEIHTQLATNSKIFSGASTAFGAEPKVILTGKNRTHANFCIHGQAKLNGHLHRFLIQNP